MEGSYAEKSWLERPMEILSRVSSERRGWNGFNAALVEVAGGTSEPIPLARHNVTMLVSSPLSTTVRCDGASAVRVQQPGMFDILPVRSSVGWTDGGYGVFLAVGLEHGFVREIADGMGASPDRLSFAHRLTCRDPKIEYLLWALKAELEQEQQFGRMYAESLGIALATQLVRRWSGTAREVVTGVLPERKLKRALSYIDDRLAQDLTLRDIARDAGFSASHFGALFKQATGVSVHRYVISRRVQRAVELITKTRVPLADVALQAGFANQSHMALAVRRSLGVTPKRLRDAC
jgi:AraC family transcriptional regulator